MKSLLERPDDQAGHEGHSHEHGGIFGMNTELIFALICGALLGAGALAGKLGLIDRLPLILYVSAYVFGGWFTTKEAVTNIRQKRFEIDSLMLLAAVGAASIGAWATCTSTSSTFRRMASWRTVRSICRAVSAW